MRIPQKVLNRFKLLFKTIMVFMGLETERAIIKLISYLKLLCKINYSMFKKLNSILLNLEAIKYQKS